MTFFDIQVFNSIMIKSKAPRTISIDYFLKFIIFWAVQSIEGRKPQAPRGAPDTFSISSGW